MVEERKTVRTKLHTLIMENREKLCLTGVLDVESFDENCMDVVTELGMLIIHGKDLHINKLNLDSKELNIDGSINSIEYEDRSGKKGIFSKMFG